MFLSHRSETEARINHVIETIRVEDKLPQVTILLAVYNSESLLERTLSSIESQTFTDFVCLIADDVSSDNSLVVARNFANRDPRFQVYQNKENLGWIGNVNGLLRRVETPYYMIMPHDDAMAPTCLELTVEALRAHPNAVVAFSDVDFHFENEVVETRTYEVPLDTDSVIQRGYRFLSGGGYWWIPYHGLVNNWHSGGELRLRHSMAGEVFADMPWVFNLALRGPFVRVPGVHFFKYIYDESVSHNWNYGLWQRLASVFSCMRCLLDSPVGIFQKVALLAVLTLKVVGPFVFLIKRFILRLVGKKDFQHG